MDPGTYTQTINLDQAADAGLVIQGAGSGGGAFDPATQTIVRATSASGTAQIRTIQDDVVLRGLRVDIPSPFQRGGLDLLANRVRVEDVLVELNWADSAAVAINTSAAKSGVVLDRVRVAAPPASRGVLAYAASMVIADSQIASGQQAVELLGPGLTIARSRLSRGGAGAVVFGSAQGLVIDSSLLTGGGAGLELLCPRRDDHERPAARRDDRRRRGKGQRPRARGAASASGLRRGHGGHRHDHGNRLDPGRVAGERGQRRGSDHLPLQRCPEPGRVHGCGFRLVPGQRRGEQLVRPGRPVCRRRRLAPPARLAGDRRRIAGRARRRRVGHRPRRKPARGRRQPRLPGASRQGRLRADRPERALPAGTRRPSCAASL